MLDKENIKNIAGKITQPKGFGIFFLSSIFSYIFLVLLDSFSLISSYLTNISVLSSILPSLILNYQNSVHLTSFLIVILTSLLIGLNLAVLMQTLTFEGLTAAPGTLFGMTVSGCAACTTGVIGLAGFSISLGFLPYNGVEVSVLGIGALSISALYISDKDRKKTCKVE